MQREEGVIAGWASGLLREQPASEGVHRLLQGLQKAQVKSNGLVIITNFTACFSASSLLQEYTEHPH